ncbi:MAG: transposase domain-containing protein, partial [Pseudomonadota bacterium]
VEPFAYLKATLEALANGHPASEVDDLLPWAFNPMSS